MGKGDKKSKKGKIWSGSYGVSRKRKKSSGFVATPKVKKAAPKVEKATTEEKVTKKPAAKKPAAKKAPAKKKPAAKK